MCFFKQKTAYELRISDWSSDVCSSDLGIDIVAAPGQRDRQAVVLIGDAEAVANRFPAVPAAQRVVPHARQIDDGRTEHRPVAREGDPAAGARSEEHTSELQSLMRSSSAVSCLQKQTIQHNQN